MKNKLNLEKEVEKMIKDFSEKSDKMADKVLLKKLTKKKTKTPYIDAIFYLIKKEKQENRRGFLDELKEIF